MFGQALLAKLGALALVLAAVFGIGWHAGGKSARSALAAEKTAHQATKGYYAAVLDGLAEQAKRVAAAAAHASDVVAAESAEKDKRLEEAQGEIDKSRAALSAALRAGNRRLQDRWTCAVPGAGKGGSAADAAQADAAGIYDSAGRIVAATDRDAAVMGWMWDRWLADRKAVIAAGCAVEAAP